MPLHIVRKLINIIKLIYSPVGILVVAAGIALFCGFLSIFFLADGIDSKLDFIRSYPKSDEVYHLFLQARVVMKLLCTAYIIVGLIIMFSIFACIISKYVNINTLNRNIQISFAVSNKHMRWQLIFLILTTSLFASPALPIVSYYLVDPWPMSKESIWLSSADKRWLILSYNAIWFALLIMPFFLRGIFTWIYYPSARRNWLVHPKSEVNLFNYFTNDRYKNTRTIIGLLVAFFLFGPPWNIDLLAREINYHLIESLASFQAIDTGYFPYIGPAAFGYGPGTQLFVYYYQLLQGGLNIVNVREAYACLNWFAASIYFAFTFRLLGIIVGLIIAVFSLSISPLGLYYWSPNGTMTGLFGWSNAFRYLGLPILMIGIAYTITKTDRMQIFARNGVILGTILGGMAYFSQENGSVTLIAIFSLLAIAWAGRRLDIFRIFVLLTSLAVGIIVVWFPIYVIYESHGLFAEFMYNYRYIPSTVFNGVTGMYWFDWSGSNAAENYFFYMPFLVILLGISCYLKLNPISISSSISTNNLILYGTLLSIILGGMSSIIRSAGSQVMNGTIGVPILLAILFVLHLYASKKKVWKNLVAWLFISLICLFFIPRGYGPYDQLHKLYDFRIASIRTALSKPETITNQKARISGPMLGLKECCRKSIGLTMQELAEIAGEMKEIVGDRRVHIESFPGINMHSFLTYLADLSPAATSREINTRFPTVESRNTLDYETIEQIEEIEVVITKDLDRRVPQAVISFFPNSRIEKIASPKGEYLVIFTK